MHEMVVLSSLCGYDYLPVGYRPEGEERYPWGSF